jgi:FMN phosphatase YigB (HAD superfamily)
MTTVLFDLGDTLIDSAQDPLPGAVQLLTAACQMIDPAGDTVDLALVSDFDGDPEDYYAILHQAGLASWFDPLSQKVTLSVEVGVAKPDAAIFRAAIDKISKGLAFDHAVFVTENPQHVLAARALGLAAIHLRGPGQPSGDVADLFAARPLLESLIASRPV